MAAANKVKFNNPTATNSPESNEECIRENWPYVLPSFERKKEKKNMYDLFDR